MSMTQAEYARHAKVHPSTVGRWLESGRISLGPDGRIDPAQADRERDASESPMPHHQARKAQIDAEKEQSRQEQRPTEDKELSKDDVMSRTKLAMMREREWTAAQREIDARRAAGELVDIAKAREAWNAGLIMIRVSLETIPPRAAPDLAACKSDVSKIEETLAGIMMDALSEGAAAFKRKLDGIG